MMSLFFKLFFCTCTILISADIISDSYDDKLVLSPVELIDMVLKERMRTLQSARRATASLIAHRSTRANDEPFAELDDDEITLKRRKVWSRWGKWGECSVTCGNGVMARQRLCAMGRCAHGEQEQQLRPCSRLPCNTPLDPD